MLNYKPQTVDDDVTHQSPVFVKQLEGPADKVKEGQSMHLECQVLPVNDPSLKIDWFFNGKPLSTGEFKSYCPMSDHTYHDDHERLD